MLLICKRIDVLVDAQFTLLRNEHVDVFIPIVKNPQLNSNGVYHSLSMTEVKLGGGLCRNKVYYTHTRCPSGRGYERNKRVRDMVQDSTEYTLDVSRPQIIAHLQEIRTRSLPSAGRRQVPFNTVETLLCYGLFYILDPHHYGGGNIDTLPAPAKKLATFFCRTPGSITSKMLNLDGSRLHSAKTEPLLFARLAALPGLYPMLYKDILLAARSLDIGEETLPDFLGYLANNTMVEELAGQDDLPNSTGLLLQDVEAEINKMKLAFQFNEEQTEKLVEQKVRLTQHRFALNVLENCGRACVFCGFEPRSLPVRNGLLRASHIKPWAVSTHQERMDVRNGLAACPIHDAAFDQGYLMVNGGYRIHHARMLLESLVHDHGSSVYFREMLHPALVLPPHAKRPHPDYLTYHRENIFKK